MSRLGNAAPALLIGCVTLNACGSEGVTTPTSSRPEPSTPPSLTVACAEGPTLHCSASIYPVGDITAQARWSAAETFAQALDIPITPSTAVEFQTPGVPNVRRRANVYIRADYTLNAPGYPPAGWAVRNIAPHAYAVDPAMPAQPLAYLHGSTYEASVGGKTLGGVAIDIIDGAAAGIHVVSRDDNASYMIEFLPLNAAFTARASKQGYTPDVRTHPGIVDSNGFPSNNVLHFALNPR
jgi:hypothetical protein